MAKKKTEKGDGDKTHKPSWRERYASMEEIEQFLSDHLYLRRNLVKGCVECRVPADDPFEAARIASPVLAGTTDDGWQRLTDYEVNSL